MEAAQVCKSMKLLPGWAPRSLQRTARWTSTHMSCKCLLHNVFLFRFSTLGVCYFSFLVFHILTSLSWLIAKLLFCVSADEWESEREREEKKHRRQNRALQSLRIRGLSLHPTKKHRLRSAGVPCFDNSQAFPHFTSGEQRRLSRKNETTHCETYT